jgi:hypothetical protein
LSADGGVEFGGILGFEESFGVVEGAELDGYAGSDSEEGGQGAFVECGAAFVAEDFGSAV